jgi:ABC-type sugar transport system ATPase subunit
VFSVADRILVLRRGRVAGVRDKAATTPDDIVRLIVGVESL